MSKGRSISTYKNKLKNLKKTYRNLYRASQKAEKAKKTRPSFFHKKYPTFEKYKSNIKIKSATGV